ncbi:MAG: hypothetical protein LBU42_02750 [Prevotellaceae bacterium]|nr:hypothetical protein [Prevotellaceae bacterium]
MKTILFFFALLTGATAFAQATVTPISADYDKSQVTFRVAWTSAANNRVWVWVDFCSVLGTAPSAFAPATITSASVTSGTYTDFNGRGFYVTANGATVTAQLNTTGKFNWCAYGSDYPPNATITTSGYQLKGTPPFIITYNSGSSTITEEHTFSLGCINTISDATGCLGLIESLAAPTTGSNGSRCDAGTVNISTTPPSGSTIDWYTTASGTTMVTNGTGVSILTTPYIYSTTNYYAASRHLITGCVSSSRRTVTATISYYSYRDDPYGGCGCASGLTHVGSYCRNLSADGASYYTGCGFEFRLSANSVLHRNKYSACPSGWSVASKSQVTCQWNGDTSAKSTFFWVSSGCDVTCKIDDGYQNNVYYSPGTWSCNLNNYVTDNFWCTTWTDVDARSYQVACVR